MTDSLDDPEHEVTPEQAAAALEQGAQLIDVREGDERAESLIPDTRHIELARLTAEASTIAQDQQVIFYCHSGVRSLMAAQAFRRAGYDAWSLAGGIVRWAQQGRAVESGS